MFTHIPESIPNFQYKQVSSQAAPTVVTYTYPSGGSHSIHTESRFAETKATPITPVIVPVSTGGSSHKSSSFRESHSSHAAPQVVYQPAPIAPSFSSERYIQSSSSGGLRPAIVPVLTPGGGSSYSRRESYTKQGSGGVIAPIAPIVTYPSGGSSSSSFREESSSSGGGFGGVQIATVGVPSGGSSSSSYREESSSSGGGGFGGSIISYPSGGSSSSFREESSSSGGGFGGGIVTYPGSTSQILSSRFSDAGFGHSNLDHYISESDRLARLQAQNIHSSTGYKASSIADLDGQITQFPSSGSQSKSWEKSSKWSSQSEVRFMNKIQ